MVTYPLGDALIQIKNAAMANRREVVLDNSKIIESVMRVMEDQKLLSKVELDDKKLKVTLAYHKKAPVIINIRLVSTPGLRHYMSVDELKSRKRRNASILVISTPKGVMASPQAEKERAGGEVIAEIW
ncbi:30S ribosomal protein S8 [Candidatus Microgenomates bacterium]|nr:MAG: 30S ribosomal protein S8 [Candidatus Microgenomates bacterium]